MSKPISKTCKEILDISIIVIKAFIVLAEVIEEIRTIYKKIEGRIKYLKNTPSSELIKDIDRDFPNAHTLLSQIEKTLHQKSIRDLIKIKEYVLEMFDQATNTDNEIAIMYQKEIFNKEAETNLGNQSKCKTTLGIEKTLPSKDSIEFFKMRQNISSTIQSSKKSIHCLFQFTMF